MPDSRLQRLPARHHRERTATMRAKSASAPTNQSQMVSVTTNGTARLLFHSISRRTALRGVGASLITSAAAALGRSTAAAEGGPNAADTAGTVTRASLTNAR